MTIGMQGSWTISVKSKSAAWAQRFRIQGSSNGVDGVYAGETSTSAVFVTGDQWGVTIEHNPAGPVSWTPSRHKLANFNVSGGQFHFDILSDDGGGTDEDFNDLVLSCSMPLSSSEYIVYGNIKTYTGFCPWNPCYPSGYIVVDTLPQLKRLLEYEPARRVIEKLYPERVKPLIRRPFPEPDPVPFKPIMIPTGMVEAPGIVVQGAAARQQEQPEVEKKSRRSRAARAKAAEEQAAAQSASLTSLSLTANQVVLARAVSQDDILALARLKDRLRITPCQVNPVSETLLRFLEYDRTEAEKLGDPYTGEGDRHELGITATDEFGNYIFHFSQSFSDVVEEVEDVASGEDLATQLRPDVILQIMESLPDGVAYESAPYYNVPNIKKINLCLPQSSVGRPPTACQSGRAIQAIGDLFIVPNPGTTLHADGTISNTSTSGPHVDHAAWHGVLDLYACFIDTEPAVKYYTLHFQREGESGWLPVNENYYHLKKQPDATWLNTKVGPSPHHVLRINGPSQPKVMVDSFLNIESDPEWLFTHRDRKAMLSSGVYQPNSAGRVTFRIVGYDADGEAVPGAVDSVTLYLDNRPSTGLIDYVKFGTEDPGECALFELSDAGSPLNVRYRVTDDEGFMAEYALSVYRGSNTFVPTRDTSTLAPVAFSYPTTHSTINPFRFHGTFDQTLDPSGYIELDLEPTGGSWLPMDKTFCAFSFELTTRDRWTDGKGTPGGRTLWRELIGISLIAPPPSP